MNTSILAASLAACSVTSILVACSGPVRPATAAPAENPSASRDAAVAPALQAGIFTVDFAREQAAKPEGWQPLFNGANLDGWTNVNTSPTTWTVGKDEAGTPVIVCSGTPTGVLRTDRQYRNFVFEMEYSHRKPGGNAGLFVWSDAICARGVPFTRSIEVQVMDGVESRLPDGRLRYTSQGDIFSIHGASMVPDRAHPEGWERCLPSEDRVKGAPAWNHYRVIGVDGTIKLEVNGKEVSGGKDIKPRQGYICLESEGSPVWFRNLRIKMLPENRMLMPAPEMRADPELAEFRPLYDGTLDQWTMPKESEGHWKPSDWTLDFDGQGGDLWSKESFGDFELIADWRWSGPSQGTQQRPVIGPKGDVVRNADGSEMTEEIAEYDSGIFLRGKPESQVNMWNWSVGSGEVWGYRTNPNVSAEVRQACTPVEKADAPIGQWNRFRIRMQGEVLNVWLNGKHVLRDATLKGIPANGPIGLQKHGSAVQWANIYVRKL